MSDIERECYVEDCGSTYRVRIGLCNKHYLRLYRRGLLPPRPNAVERFVRNIQVTETCWLWVGYRDRNGYGRCWPKGSTSVLAHRYSYEWFVEPIPKGLTLDHLCRVPACVRPEHLEPVTLGENVRRGFGPSAVNARKTHCIRGHEFDGENTYRAPTGNRVCRTCVRDSRRQEVA